MRSARNPIIGFNMLLLLVSLPVLAQDQPTAAVVSRLEALTAKAGADEPVVVRFTLTNTTGAPITILKWHTPLEGFDSDMFDVERDGRRVLYIGREVKRGAPEPEDYLTIQAGSSVSAEIDLSKGYALSEAGGYRARYRSEILIPASGPASLESAQPEALPRELTTNTVSFELTEARAVPPLPEVGLAPSMTPEDVREGRAAKQPAFQSCSQEQITQIEEAHAKAGQMAGLALLAISLTKEENRTNVPRYKEWFGAYTAARYTKVEDHFSRIFGALDRETVTYHCDCNDSAYAYVYPNNPYHIWLCRAFWPAPLEGTDSKAGTIVHETSHFTVVADTDDHNYGQPSCRNLAKSDPDKATTNADSHEYFAENDPHLDMGLEHVALALLTIGLAVSAERLWRSRRVQG